MTTALDLDYYDVLDVADNETLCQQIEKQVDQEAAEEFVCPTPEEMQQAVLGLKAKEQAASQFFYEHFRWLVKSVAYRYSIFTSLGEDAENIAWLILFETVNEYQGEQYATLPIYLKKALIWRLMDAATSRKHYDPHVEHNEIALQLEPAFVENYWDQATNDINLRELLKELKPVEQKIILLFYFYNYRKHEIADILHITPNSVRYHLYKATHKLKGHYSS